jgi:tetratricopeptide (TPR) repeat protein
VLLLSQHRGDARAYNNLGNLSVMKGYYAVALAYYDSALRSDTSDAGVHLNRAAVHLLLGEEDEAVHHAAVASQLAGGAEQAGELLGLHGAAPDSARAAEKKVLSQSDMKALLKKASQSVPSGKPAPQQGGNDERGQGKRTPVWRSGTTRAAQAPVDAADAATALYWKR